MVLPGGMDKGIQTEGVALQVKAFPERALSDFCNEMSSDYHSVSCSAMDKSSVSGAGRQKAACILLFFVS